MPIFTQAHLSLHLAVLMNQSDSLRAESLGHEMDNGAVLHALRFSNQSESGSIMHQASLKGQEGPALVVFSGGTAFNSVAGLLLARMPRKPCHPLSCQHHRKQRVHVSR